MIGRIGGNTGGGGGGGVDLYCIKPRFYKLSGFANECFYFP